MSFKNLFLIIIIYIYSLAGFSQDTLSTNFTADDSRFEFSWKLDAPLLIGGGGLALTGYLIKENVTPLTEEQVLSLDRSMINSFDRGATFLSRSASDKTSDYFLYGSILSPITLFVSKSVRRDMFPVLLMYVETAAVVGGITNMIKGTTVRNRPYVYHEGTSMGRKLSKDARHSFISGHVSHSAAFCFVTGYMISRYADKEYIKVLGWTGAALIPAATGYLRYQAGKHFPTDIIGGYIIGAATGYLIPYLHRTKLPQDITQQNLYLFPSPGGFALIYRFD